VWERVEGVHGGACMTVPDMTVLSADGQPSASTIRRLYELSNHLLGVCDAGRLIVVNPAWERALGWSTRELLSLDDWTRLVHLDRVNGCTAESGLRRSTEIRIRTADGRYRTFSWTAISDGRLWYSLGIDITAMRADTELVRRLAAIVAHSDDAIVSTDRHAAI